jgi:hypothetical protein
VELDQGSVPAFILQRQGCAAPSAKGSEFLWGRFEALPRAFGPLNLAGIEHDVGRDGRTGLFSTAFTMAETGTDGLPGDAKPDAATEAATFDLVRYPPSPNENLPSAIEIYNATSDNSCQESVFLDGAQRGNTAAVGEWKRQKVPPNLS